MLTVDRCRSCGSDDLEDALALGDQPLANALVTPGSAPAAERRHPLTLAFCRSCSLAQLRETVPPEELFSDYVYFSSFSDTMLAHAKESADELVRDLSLGPKSLAVEVASNDGYQLQYFEAAGVPVLGIEPAANIAAEAEKKGIPTRVEFFGAEAAARLAGEGCRADVLLAFNVMAHVPDMNGFVAGIRTLLAPEGVAVIEAPHVAHLVDRLEFDTIYHEHVFYLSVSALRPLFERHGLELIRVREVAIHGGSLRLYVAPKGSRPVEDSVPALCAREEAAGLVSGEAYRALAERVLGLREETVALIDGLLAEGRRVAAYGAAAKGSTQLNYYGIGADRLEFVADRSPHKQGKLMPGVRVPIEPAEHLAASRPDYCLLLTWNFADEILAQQQAYRDAGGKFIVPIPEPRIV